MTTKTTKQEYQARVHLGRKLARWSGQDPVGIVASAFSNGMRPLDARNIRMATSYLEAELKDPRPGATKKDLAELRTLIKALGNY